MNLKADISRQSGENKRMAPRLASLNIKLEMQRSGSGSSCAMQTLCENNVFFPGIIVGKRTDGRFRWHTFKGKGSFFTHHTLVVTQGRRWCGRPTQLTSCPDLLPDAWFASDRGLEILGGCCGLRLRANWTAIARSWLVLYALHVVCIWSFLY